MSEDRHPRNDPGDETSFGGNFRQRDDAYVTKLKAAGGFREVQLPPKFGPHAGVPLARASRQPSAPAEARPVAEGAAPSPRAPDAPRSVGPRDERLRPIEAIAVGPAFKRAAVPPPPKIAWLPISVLVIDDTYQRGLAQASLALIRKLAAKWDWNRFKPLSVAPTADGRYEVIDGQHTAIAAATNGAIELLPCLVLAAATTAAKSAAFVGINLDRVRLTPFALFRARLAAGDDALAKAAGRAMAAAGVTLVETIRHDRTDYPVGTTACIASLISVVRHYGEDPLTRILRIAVAAEVRVISSTLVNGLAIVAGVDDGPTDEALSAAIRKVGAETIVTRANIAWRTGSAPNIRAACERVLLTAVGR